MKLARPPLNKDTKRSLILAGGGVRLAYQAGVLQALDEHGLSFQHIDGTSGGIFNTAMLVSGLCPDEMAGRWRGLNLKHFISARPLKEYFRPTRLFGFGDADGIRKKVFPSLGIDVKKIRENERFKATFNVCNFSEKTIESIDQKNITEDHLVAGVSLPIFMDAVRIGSHWYSDAVWIKDANLMEAVRRGAEELWVVWAIGNAPEYMGGAFNQYVHMIEMSANGGLFEEYAQIELINRQIKRGDSIYGQRQPIKLHVIKPRIPLPLDPDLFLNKIDTSTLIDMGYADAKMYLDNVPEAGLPFTKASTQMEAPGVNLTFKQKYSGYLFFRGERCLLTFASYFTYRPHKGGGEILSTSGISLNGRTASGQRNCAKREEKAGMVRVLSTCVFMIEGTEYACTARFPLASPIDWLMGLAFKKVHISLHANNGETRAPVLEGWLTQSIRDRFVNLFSISVNHYTGGGWKGIVKFKMIKSLYSL